MSKKQYRIGETNINTQGLKMTIIEYNSATDMIVVFEDGFRKKCAYKEFKNGNVRNNNYKIITSKNLKEERLGEVRNNHFGTPMKIIEYNNFRDIIVEFQDEYKYQTHSRYDAFLDGRIKNPYDREIMGIACCGIQGLNHSHDKEYDTWRAMLTRCYDKTEKERHPTYKDVSCVDEWLNFDIFFNWIIQQENYLAWKEDKLSCLDKDILKRNNKVYSPETCLLVPFKINSLFINIHNNKNGLPSGVYLHECKYTSSVSYMVNNIKRKKFLGYFNSADEAFNAYKIEKEKKIKEYANEYYKKGLISKEGYNALMSYEVIQ